MNMDIHNHVSREMMPVERRTSCFGFFPFENL
jgi:hypothetical protein